MKTINTSISTKLVALMAGAALFGLVSQSALAACTAGVNCTAPGTSITNTALLDYKVGGIAQTQKSAVSTPFVVDEKVNLTVATVSGATVVPGALAQVATFTVTNLSNSPLDFSLNPIATAGTFLPSGCIARVENTVAGVAGYDATDTATFIDELATGVSATVYAICNIPVAATDTQTGLVGMVATARGDFTTSPIGAYTATPLAGGVAPAITFTPLANADTPGTVDIVFADIAGTDDIGNVGLGAGVRDGAHSARATYTVATAALTVSKSSAVYSDPINGTIKPKAIPGAVVTYTITIQNTGAVGATSVSISDSLAAEITAGHLAFATQFTDATNACAAAQGIVVIGGGEAVATQCKTNATDVETVTLGEFTAANVVNVTGLSVAAASTATIKYQVIVQ